MRRGELVADGVVVSMVRERAGCLRCRGGFLLDGFPRTATQARALDDMLGARGQNLDLVVALEVPRSLLIERAVLRRIDKRTGQIYHLKYSAPPPGADLEHRVDDREDVVGKRLDTYEAMTAELLPYYESRGILKRVDGVGDVEQVTEHVFAAVGADS
jgi:adenylate kinase